MARHDAARYLQARMNRDAPVTHDLVDWPVAASAQEAPRPMDPQTAALAAAEVAALSSGAVRVTAEMMAAARSHAEVPVAA